MKHPAQIIISFLILTLAGTAACQPVSVLQPGQMLKLVESAENYVDVSITLERRDNDQFFLSATFTPLNSGLHLYSKEIPKTGLDGLGRPTLLELSKDSPIKTIGELLESTTPQPPTSPPFDLLIYPEGPVTLSYQILLPEGSAWLDDEVIVTYMACDDTGCRAPVQQKPIAIKIPGKGLFH
jgi:hypothetical protein